MRLLIAEDDPTLAEGLTRALRDAGYAVDRVADGNAADAALASSAFDLIILDLAMPGMSGLDVLQRLRSRKSNVPVLILTARDGMEDRVRGLDLGADDYLTKPFGLAELQARVRALARRSRHAGHSIVEHGALSFDTVGRVARLDGEIVDLSARELSLLEILISKAGRMVSKEQIIDRLCEWGDEVSANAIEVYIHRLRKKLEPGGVRITSQRGLGYCLDISSRRSG